VTFVNQYGELDEVQLFSRLNAVSLDIVRVGNRTLYAMAIDDQLLLAVANCGYFITQQLLSATVSSACCTILQSVDRPATLY